MPTKSKIRTRLTGKYNNDLLYNLVTLTPWYKLPNFSYDFLVLNMRKFELKKKWKKTGWIKSMKHIPAAAPISIRLWYFDPLISSRI